MNKKLDNLVNTDKTWFEKHHFPKIKALLINIIWFDLRNVLIDKSKTQRQQKMTSGEFASWNYSWIEICLYIFDVDVL